FTNSYVWSSNNYFIKTTGKPKYNSHLITLYAFNKYQQRAWEIFIKHLIIGTEKAIESYLHIYSETTKAYLNDPNGESFFEYLDKVVRECRDYEKKSLEAFTSDTNLISAVVAATVSA